MLTCLAAISLVAATALPPTPVEGVRFQSKPAQVGDVTTRRMVSEMSMEIEVFMGGQSLQKANNGQSQDRTLKVAVLEADADGASKVSFEIVAEKNTQKTPVGDQSFEGELVGEVFHVHRADGGGASTVTYADGGEVEDATADLVRKEANPAGRKDLFDPTAGLGEAVPDEVEVGQKIQVDPEVAKRIFDAASRVDEMTLTLKEKGDGEGGAYGLFDVVLHFTIDEPTSGISMSMKLRGEASIFTASRWMRGMKLQGPITVTGGNEQIQMSGSGDMSLNATASYGG